MYFRTTFWGILDGLEWTSPLRGGVMEIPLGDKRPGVVLVRTLSVHFPLAFSVSNHFFSNALSKGSNVD